MDGDGDRDTGVRRHPSPHTACEGVREGHHGTSINIDIRIFFILNF